MSKEEFILHFEEVLKRMSDTYIRSGLREGLERYKNNQMSEEDEYQLSRKREFEIQSRELNEKASEIGTELTKKYGLSAAPEPEIKAISDHLDAVNNVNKGNGYGLD